MIDQVVDTNSKTHQGFAIIKASGIVIKVSSIKSLQQHSFTT